MATRCGQCDGCRWGGVCSANRLYMGGNVLGDLHDGAGTSWTKTPEGQYYPNCDCHGPESLRGTWAAASTPRKAKRPSGAVVGPQDTPPGDDIDNTTALKLLATWLRRLAKERK